MKIRETLSPRFEQVRAARIVELRTNLGMSQRDLAEAAVMSRSYLCDIERGRGTTPSPALRKRLALALGVSPSELVDQSDVVGDHDRDVIDARLKMLGEQAMQLAEAIHQMRSALAVDRTEPEQIAS
jgi:transcriptional regulator with XRE-family HTH domain